ncbi:hypothetical protein Goarm_002439, partial [Gossypium armourianum]|nr:hypothetical protein [Gossypium armourianum]
FKQKVTPHDDLGRPLITATDDSNPWWTLIEEAINKANGKIGKPEILSGATDARYFRQLGLTAIGFSPITNTPFLLHDHNEFLNKAEYFKGINVYESIIEAYTSYIPPGRDGVSRDEFSARWLNNVYDEMTINKSLEYDLRRAFDV